MFVFISNVALMWLLMEFDFCFFISLFSTTLGGVDLCWLILVFMEVNMGKYDLDSLALEARKNNKTFRALLEASEYIIKREVSRFATGSNSCHYDEYQSEAITSLYNNLYKFDQEKGAFSSFISRCIDQAIIDYIREKQNVMSIGSTKLN